MPSGAEVIVSQLAATGVSVVFGLPGVHNLALWEALRGSGIRLVGVRHEQAAVYAADGYARATGRMGVALTTTGPGAANTLGAVGEAFASRSPVLVICTDIPSGLRREGVYRGVLHETRDQAAMFAPVTVWQDTVSPRDPLAFGLWAAVGRARSDGPVYFGIATDVLRQERPDEAFVTYGAVAPEPPGALDALLTDAERPLLWVGSDAERAPVVSLADALGAPVIETYGGRGVMPPDHPCRVGLPPHLPAVGRLWDEADLVVAIGDPLDGMTTQNWAQPQPPRLITVGTETPNYRTDAHVAALAPPPGHRPPPDLAPIRAEAVADLDPRALRFLDAIASATPADASLVCDMCIPGYWIAGFHPFAAPRLLQYPVGWGTLGYAFPAALGAALAGVDRGPVISISGDGGFLYAPGELATLVQERIPLTAVIVDDGGYGMLRYDQDVAGEPRFGVDLHTPDFEALARAFGVRAETVHDLDEAFGEALARHVADPEPSVLVAKAEALVPPPTTSPNWYRRRSTGP